jgi:hypothetical protein
MPSTKLSTSSYSSLRKQVEATLLLGQRKIESAKVDKGLRRIILFVLAIFIFTVNDAFAGYVQLTKKNYEESKADKAVVIYGVNWGRQWGCAQFENAQLQKLKFSRIDPESNKLNGEDIALNIPSVLLAENISNPYAIIVDPGEYALTGFDVKIAESVRKIGHLKAESKDLFVDGKPVGGTFKVNAGEIVYIGNFGLDCAYEPIPWRYYVEKNDFERYVNGFKKKYKFLADKQFIYRLFQTDRFGL